MKRNITQNSMIILLIIVTLALWFSDLLPKQIAEIVAIQYLLNKNEHQHYSVENVEYSNAQDCYMVHFKNLDHYDQPRHLGINYRFIPFQVFYDSNFPG